MTPNIENKQNNILKSIERVLENHEAVQNMTRYCKICQAPALEKHDLSSEVAHEDDCPVPAMQRLAKTLRESDQPALETHLSMLCNTGKAVLKKLEEHNATPRGSAQRLKDIEGPVVDAFAAATANADQALRTQGDKTL